MQKLFVLGLLACGIIGGTSLVRLQLHLGEVKLVHWSCGHCHAENVSDANEAFYPSCRGCGEKLGWDELAVAEGL
ncbi:MAG: hypothetical protein AAF532_14065 [Planctomycetota bacterium]